jgi:hypothetical protein
LDYNLMTTRDAMDRAATVMTARSTTLISVRAAVMARARARATGLQGYNCDDHHASSSSSLVSSCL